MRPLILALLCSLACVDLNVTFKVPCHASLVRDTTSLDTLAVWKADTLGCPR